MENEIHVLLVEHDSVVHDNTKQMLEIFSYKVTAVKLASTALSILSKGKAQLDAVIANAESPDSCGFKLVQDASKMGILVILVSDEDDIATTVRALQEGAYMCIKKPIQAHMVKYLWQHVARENRRREIKRCFTLNEDDASNYLFDKNPNDKDDEDDVMYPNKKVWTEWTQELHDKFIAAVRILGEGRCYPKEILDLMNVPGLTRMQVASHLQKCRSGKWQHPNERKSKSNNNQEIMNPSKNKPRRAKPMRFGSMPFGDYEASPLQFGIGAHVRENPNLQGNQDFVISQTTDKRSCNVLETGAFKSAANTTGFADHHHHEIHNPHFVAEPHQDYYNNHFITHVGSSEGAFNNMGQLGLNNLSNEQPFDMLHVQSVSQSSNGSNQSNVNSNSEECGFEFAGILMAQNFSNTVQQGLGLVNDNSGLSLQGFCFEQGCCYNQDKVPDANGDEEFDSQM